MSFGNFIVDNLASIWKNSSLGFGGLFNSKTQQNSLSNNLAVREVDAKDANNLSALEDYAKNTKIKQQVDSLRASGWSVDTVNISDRADLLEKTEKAMADAMKSGNGTNSGILVQTTYGRVFAGNMPTNPLDKYMPKPNIIPKQVVGEEFILNAGIKIFEFQGNSSSAQAILQAQGKKGMSITNIAKPENKENLTDKVSPAEALLAQSTYGTYSVFERVDYKYSYSKNTKTHELTKISLEKNETGTNFIAKKLEIKNQVIDFRGAEYIYSDVKNTNTNQPYRIENFNNYEKGTKDFLFELIAKKNHLGGIDDRKIAESELADFLKASGVKAGKFSIITPDGKVQNFVVTKDFELLNEEDFVLSQMSDSEQKAYYAGDKSLFNEKLELLRENDFVSFK